MSSTTADLVNLRNMYLAVRSETERRAEPLSAEDQTAQSMPDTSPTKWHRAHTTWFFETFVLEAFEDGFVPFDASFRVLFNSYYEAVGPKYPRPKRGLVTRPGVERVGEYRAAVDERICNLLASFLDQPGDHDLARLIDLVTLGLHHEQQHQELLLMDIKHLLSLNPELGQYQAANPVAPADAVRANWLEIEGGVVSIGFDGRGFSFDNEAPRHQHYLASYALADRLVSVGEWRAFIADGGYERSDLWLSDGWNQAQQHGWDSPLYWQDQEGFAFTFAGLEALSDDEPVKHVSHYEADAYARWAGARLPTEFEWEHAVVTQPSLAQVSDSAWQWTASAYLPYPGFQAAPGAVGEYNGKFMSGQMVLRGGAAITPAGHTRPSYRNFFPASARWPMTGVRLAKSRSKS